MKRTPNIAIVSADILAEVERAERVKQAELQALHEVTPSYASEIGTLMHKVADALRSDKNEISYDDLKAFQEGRL
jgi:hypothetical protein